MWDPKSPWADQRVRLAASHAHRPQGAERGGDARRVAAQRRLRAARISSSRMSDRAARLRPGEGQEAPRRGGLSERLRRRRLPSVPPYYSAGEAVAGYLQAVGIRTQHPNDGARRVPLRLERQDAARRLHVHRRHARQRGDAHVRSSCPSDGQYAYGGWPDVDALCKQQARETDKKKREALLQRIQQIAVRPRALRRDLRLRLAERRRATGGRAGVPADRPVSVVRAVRGAAPQEVRLRSDNFRAIVQ